MAAITFKLQEFQAVPSATSILLGILFLFIIKFIIKKSRRAVMQAAVPEVPGLPLLGNLLQLTEKKPHKTFTRLAETHGPIFSIRLGASTLIVLNSTDLAKEAMVTRYSSISTRKLSTALEILTSNKSMVAMSDYNEFHKIAKRHLLTNVLGTNAQKQHRCHRDTMMENVSKHLHSYVKNNPLKAVNFREIFKFELFGLALKQALGEDIESIYVDAIGTEFSREEIFQVLVIDQMMGAIEVDWRDFFPYLKWIPNKSIETKINGMDFRRQAVMKALIGKQRKRISSGEVKNSYLDHLLSEATNFSEKQINMLIWEDIIETSDTTLVTTEWALYQLAKDPARQACLYHDIRTVCGSDKIKEEDMCRLPYLSAIFHETLRKYSPVPIIPPRYVHEDTQLGGYHVPAGSEIAINIYGCNMDKKQWADPEEWRPERFVDEKYDPNDLYKTMAFGAGKRVCAGSIQAMTISCLVIGRLVQEFEWRLNKGEEENVDSLGLTTHKLHPMQAILTPRHP